MGAYTQGVVVVVIFIAICVAIGARSYVVHKRLRRTAMLDPEVYGDDGLGRHTFPAGTYPPTGPQEAGPIAMSWSDPYGWEGEPLPRYEPPPSPPPPFEEKMGAVARPDHTYDPDVSLSGPSQAADAGMPREPPAEPAPAPTQGPDAPTARPL